MSVTFGFYNSLNGDRRYDAIQMSSIFDGIIEDGVYQSIGDRFFVKPLSTPGLGVTVGTGRAWFDHTWTLNNSILVLEAPVSEAVLNRIDMVVLEVDATTSIRENSIKYVRGTPATDPVRPTLIKTETVHQYPLAYINRAAGTNTIQTKDITITVGTSACPYVIGVLEVLNIDDLWARWEAQWDAWFSQNTKDADNQFSNWLAASKGDFEAWFSELAYLLDGDAGAKMAKQIVELMQFRETLMKEHCIYDPLQDHEGEYILDSYGNEIIGRTVFCTNLCNSNRGTTIINYYPGSGSSGSHDPEYPDDGDGDNNGDDGGNGNQGGEPESPDGDTRIPDSTIDSLF